MQPSAASSLSEILSGWTYQPPLDAVIRGLKFGRLEFLGRDLAAGLQRVLADAEGEFDVVVPIPLHWHRRLTRAYNQAEAIARPLARHLDLPLVEALRRRRATRAQAQLTRTQREINLRLAFAPIEHKCAKIVGRRILLVDDVVTTGATLESAARCLRDRGVRSVTAVTAGRTPGPAGSKTTIGTGESSKGFDRAFLNSI